jgi:hypothetical protein
MASSGMLRRVAPVKAEVSKELSASIRVTRIGELGTSNRHTQILSRSRNGSLYDIILINRGLVTGYYGFKR